MGLGRFTIVFYSLFFIVVISLVHILFPSIYEVFAGLVLRAYIFVKAKSWLAISGFFLVKGKFVLLAFLKKLALLLPIGLAKRFFIEKIFLKNFKEHYLDKLPIKSILLYLKNRFITTGPIKKIVSIIILIASSYYVIKFFGFFLFFKILIAKVWSFLLFLIIKLTSFLTYFFGTYIWSSWLTPLIEIYLISWILKILEKNANIKKFLEKIYIKVNILSEIINYYTYLLFHKPLQKIFYILTKKSNLILYKIMKTSEDKETLKKLKRFIYKAELAFYVMDINFHIHVFLSIFNIVVLFKYNTRNRGPPKLNL